MASTGSDGARYGLRVQVSLASVPGFAPRHADASRYRTFLTGARDEGDGGDDIAGLALPLPEVLAWHREHHPDVTAFEDFGPGLTLVHLDLGAIARLAADAGAVLLTPALGRDTDAPGIREPRFDHVVPDLVPDGAWRLRRGLAWSLGFNRIEQPDDHLTPAGLVAVLTEVVAKGGRLELVVGLRADGSVPGLAADRLREAGAWVRANRDVIEAAERFEVWGDESIRFTVTPTPPEDAPEGTRRLNVIDLVAAPERTVAHLSPHRLPVEAVHGAADWYQDAGGLHLRLDPTTSPSLAAVYRVDLRAVRRGAIPVRSAPTAGAIHIGDRPFATIGAALAAARPGDAVDLGPGSFGAGEALPLEIPPGVTLRSRPAPPGQAAGDRAVIDGAAAGADRPTVVLAGANSALDSVEVGGDVDVLAPDASVSFNRLPGGRIRVRGADRVTITGNRLTGGSRPVGIEVDGGIGHRIDGNDIDGPRTAVHLRATDAAQVSANRTRSRAIGIHLDGADHTDVIGNQARDTMRAVDVAGGRGNRVTANVADGCDSGTLVHDGARDTTVELNRWSRCRVALLRWDDRDTLVGTNTVVGSTEHDEVTGP